jgi:hypothetical protein
MLANWFLAKGLNSLGKPLPVAGQSTTVKVERRHQCEPAKADGVSIDIQCLGPGAGGTPASAPKH